MKLGVFGPVLYDKTFEKALDKVVEYGLDAIEIGCGNFVGDKHCKPAILLKSPEKLKAFETAIQNRGLTISALSCHGNPLHPTRKIASEHALAQRNTILLAEKLGVDRVIFLAGCPGDGGQCRYPNWAVPGMSGLGEEERLWEWQWREKVIPFWQSEANFAHKHGVDKLCFEIHGGDVVFNPRTFFKLKKAIGKIAGVNFDPSHLFWQGIDPNEAILELGGSIHHVHGKDTYIADENVRVNGVLDANIGARLSDRSWYFRTTGYGHDALVWKTIVSSLRLVNYDYVISIEHEDALMSREEGLRKSIEFLKGMIISEPAAGMWWA